MINISKVRADITKEVTINLESVRYSCELQLRNKLTCIMEIVAEEKQSLHVSYSIH